MEQFANPAPNNTVPTAVQKASQPYEVGDETGEQLCDLKLNNIEVSISPEEIQAMLAREGKADFLPHELGRKIQEASIASGLTSIKAPVSRKELKNVCDTLEERIKWIDSKISQIDARDRPEVVTREGEINDKCARAISHFENNAGSNIVMAGFFGTFISGITVGCTAGSFVAGIVGGAVAIGLAVLAYYRFRSEAVEGSRMEFSKKERDGDADYQEPINARLLEIYARHDNTPFSSDREKRIAFQGDLLQFQRSLEQTQNSVRGLTTDLHALGLALKHSSPISTALLNERQALQALQVLEDKSIRSGKDAAALTKVLGEMVRGEELTETSLELEGHLDVLAAMRSEGRFKNPEIEAKFQSLLENTAARAEL